MYFSGSWNYNAFTTDITGFEWGVMPSPVGSVSGSAILGGSGLAVPENSANKDLALSFIKWFYEEENFSYYLDLDKGLSSLTGVTYQPADEKAAADYTVLQAEVGQTTTLFSVDESSMWRNYLDNEYRDALKQAVNGDMTAEEALNDFAAALAEKPAGPNKAEKKRSYRSVFETPRPDGRGVFARQTGRETCGMEKPQYTAAHLKGMNRHVVYDFIREREQLQSADRQGNGISPPTVIKIVSYLWSGVCGGEAGEVRPAWDAGRSCWPSTGRADFRRCSRWKVRFSPWGWWTSPAVCSTGRKHARRRISARFWPRCATGW